MYLNQQEVEQLYLTIQEHETIIIHRHVRPDPDAFGSQLGLKALIEHNFPDKKVYAVGTMSKGLEWMGAMDQISTETYQDALVIVTDTANQDRIDDQRFNKGKKLIKIDHHPIVDTYGDFQIVYPQASSCSELIVEISQALGSKFELNLAAAEVLYAGIVGDTGRFMFDSTSEVTFLAAAKLKSMGVNTFQINDRFNVMSQNLINFQAYVINNLNILQPGVAYLMISREILTEYGISEEESNDVVNLPSTIEGVYTWCMFVEQEGSEEHWRIRLRSKGPTINKLAEKYGGGGHAKASGANAYSSSEIQKFVTDLVDLTQTYLALENSNK